MTNKAEEKHFLIEELQILYTDAPPSKRWDLILYIPERAKLSDSFLNNRVGSTVTLWWRTNYLGTNYLTK